LSVKGLKKSQFLMLLIVVVLLAAGSVLLFLHLSNRTTQRYETLTSVLKEADAALESGRYERTESLLTRAFDLEKRADARLMVLKRSYRLCRERGDYTQLAEWAGSARQSDPTNPALLRLAVLAQLRAGRPEAAQKILAERKTRRLIRSEPDLQYLAAEAALRGPNNGQEVWLPPELKAIVSLERSVHPSALIEQGRVSGDPRYFLDAALLWMRRGQAGNARALVMDELRDAYHEAAAYISYDAGAGEEAARRAALLVRAHPDRADYRRFYGDLLYQKRRYAEAQAMYIRALQLDPDAGWQLLLSLASALEKSGDSDSARFYTTRAYKEFPSVREVLFRYAGDLERAGLKERAAGLVRSYLVKNPEDAELQLLYLRLSGAPYSGKELWKLFNRFPEDPGLARELIEYMLSSADLRSTALAINQHLSAAPASEDAPWLLEARAMHAALSGDTTLAESLLVDKAVLEDSWQSRYNLAVILGAEARYSEGIAELMTAESLLPENGDSHAVYRSKIRSRLGEYYAALGDAISARRELNYAVELDPVNLQARLLLKKLDEAAEKW
jgi:tetratricopeptide (TPR) repeat protein